MLEAREGALRAASTARAVTPRTERITFPAALAPPRRAALFLVPLLLRLAVVEGRDLVPPRRATDFLVPPPARDRVPPLPLRLAARLAVPPEDRFLVPPLLLPPPPRRCFLAICHSPYVDLCRGAP